MASTSPAPTKIPFGHGTAKSAAVPLVAAMALVALLSAFLYNMRLRRQASLLPPGPKPNWSGTPLPQRTPWRYLYELSKQMGPLITIWFGTTPTVICNDMATVDFLLEKNARETTDRPHTVASLDYLWGKRPLFIPYGERWRRVRKALHSALQPTSAKYIRVKQEQAARDVIKDIVAKPDHFQDHIHTYTATLVVNMAYGRTGRARYSDPDIAQNIVCGDRLGMVLRPGTLWIQSFPWLRYIPGYMRTIDSWADEEINLFRMELAKVQDRLKRGEDQADCFATYLLQNQRELQLSTDEVASLCGSIFGAGSDTTSAALTILVMAAATFPEAQKRVQAELDSVFGKTPPAFDELSPADAVPVLRAFIAETFRWRPVSAGGFAHKSTAEISYKGHVIPKGTLITGNHYAISRDEAYYGPNVEDFVIDRWLVQDDEGAPELKPRMKHVQFGFGRRVCPGQHVANNSVLINSALLLWSFNISKKRDASGKEIDIDTYAFTDTANIHPLPFQAQFTPRHEGLETMLIDHH